MAAIVETVVLAMVTTTAMMMTTAVTTRIQSSKDERLTGTHSHCAMVRTPLIPKKLMISWE